MDQFEDIEDDDDAEGTSDDNAWDAFDPVRPDE